MAEASVNSMLLNPDVNTHYDSDYRKVIEDHMTYLRTNPNTQLVTVSPMQAYKYEFDMTGLLLELGIPLQLHWVIVRMNHLSSLTNVPPDLTQLLLPPEVELNRIRQTFESIANKIASA